MHRRIALAIVLAVVALHAQPADIGKAATALIASNCLTCHNPAAHMGGLVLVNKASALKGGKSGPAIADGRPDASLLYTKVQAGQMPMGNPLPAADRDLVRRWIESGAPWEGELAVVERKRADKTWWSLQPVRKIAPPASGNAPQGWTSAIDRYVLAALTAKKLTPSPEADRRTLIRRATFDLTGLPPAPAEIEAFVNDTRADAYERVVERLLGSPAYGERWGRHWLDVIRFGESNGYEKNLLRDRAWPFRDYIIRSFNEDKPFDRLVLEQLAGDQFEKADPPAGLGTGFLVAGTHDDVANQNLIGTLQQRSDDLDDMVNATSAAFLGLTVNCARCHDHKFDPIQQADYYRMAAIFAGVQHAERDIATPEERRRRKELLSPLEESFGRANKQIEALRERARPILEPKRAAVTASFRPPVDPHATEERFAPVRARWVRFEILATNSGVAPSLDEIEVWSSAGFNVALASAGAKVSASSTRVAAEENFYSVSALTDGKHDKRWFGGERNRATITIELPDATDIDRFIWSADYLGGMNKRIDGPLPADYRIAISRDGKSWQQVSTSRDRLPYLEKDREDFLLRSVLPAAEQAEWRDLVATAARLKQQIAEVPPLPAAYIGKFQQPKDPVLLLKGGSVANPGDPVAPGSLSTLAAVLPGFEMAVNAPEAERRNALARWITDSRNPLTPRVLANRIWHYHFGRGLVGTPSDFGFNGERPSNPELLDYLATRLLEVNWKMKPLHREIMLSAAYRQASAPVAANLAIDSESQYLWRFPPRRLEAEEIRDGVLAVSGALDRRMGGPGFRLYRYTVDNVATYAPLDKYAPETFRRSVYHEAPRSLPVELLSAFDCPDPSLPEPRRGVTTSPLQALDLLNGPFITGQAHLFAARLKREFGTSIKQQAEGAFRLALGRDPSAKELAAAVDLISRDGLDLFCLTLFNSNEFIYVM